jgi:hypothetical protein
MTALSVNHKKHLAAIGLKFAYDWKNIYRRLQADEYVTVDQLEKIASNYGVYLSIDEIRLLTNKFGASVDLDSLT